MNDYSDYNTAWIFVIGIAGMVGGTTLADYSDYMITEFLKAHHEIELNIHTQSCLNFIYEYKSTDIFRKNCNRVIRVGNRSTDKVVMRTETITAVCNHCNQEGNLSGSMGRGTCKTTGVLSINFIIGTYLKESALVCGFLGGDAIANVQTGTNSDGIEKDYGFLNSYELFRAVENREAGRSGKVGKNEILSFFRGSRSGWAQGA